MKITLDASIKEHREIAELFRGYECEEQGLFVGIGYPTETEARFICDIGHSYEPFRYIDIDLNQAKMDLRTAIGTGIEFEIDCGDGEFFSRKSTQINALDNEVFEYSFCEIEGISEIDIKLCPDYLELVGVEVEE